MSNVTPNRAELQQGQKEGAGQAVVLFCCVLFLTFQIYSFCSPSFSTKQPVGDLVVTAPQSLQLGAASERKKPEDINQSFSPGNYHFSPFFFELIAINYCDKSLLMSIKGIGPSLAESILLTRERRGGYKTAEDLLQVKGIGPGRLRQFTPYFNFSVDHVNQ